MATPKQVSKSSVASTVSKFISSVKSKFSRSETGDDAKKKKKTASVNRESPESPNGYPDDDGDEKTDKKDEDDDEDAVQKNVRKVILKEIAKGDARVIYIRKAPPPEEGRCYTLACCLAIILILLILITSVKLMKGN